METAMSGPEAGGFGLHAGQTQKADAKPTYSPHCPRRGQNLDLLRQGPD